MQLQQVVFQILAATLAGAAVLTPAAAQFQQQMKLVGAGHAGMANQGRSAAISADGSTVLIGGPLDNNMEGAVWVYTINSGTWTQQGVKLTPGGASLPSAFGYSVALSSDGNTALIGGPFDNSQTGAVWVFVRNNGVWTQQGEKLIAVGAVPGDHTGYSVALSGDGNTALFGSPLHDSTTGAAYVYVRNGGVWAQQGMLIGSGAIRPGALGAEQGTAVALSSDGNTALIGGAYDNDGIGAAWVFIRPFSTMWSEQTKLVGSGYIASQESSPMCSSCVGQGASVALSSNGNTAIVGGPYDNHDTGAVWAFTRDTFGSHNLSGVWTQSGNKVAGEDSLGASHQGSSVAISGDGTHMLEGGPSDNSDAGAIWLFSAYQGAYTQVGSKTIVDNASAPSFGASVAMSGAGETALAGGPEDANGIGAAWFYRTALGFYPLTPCRAVDTRDDQGKQGPFGPPSLEAYVTRDFPLQSTCGLPRTATAYSLNLTALPSGPLPFLSTWPAGQPYPNVSTLNSPDADVIANAAIVPAGIGGSITVVAGAPAGLIVDMNGYFAPDNGSELLFYPLRPCRVVDTRGDQGKTGAFGPPALAAYAPRDFPLTSDDCGIPITAQAFALNVTAVPQGALSFLSIYPDGFGYDGASTLNSPDGNTVANAAIIGAGHNSGITVVTGNLTDLIVDVNGYFGPPSASGLHFYPVVPCRVVDTRSGQGKMGPFGPPALDANTTRDFPISTGSCNIPSTAQAYSLNFTVVPYGPLAYMSVWPAGQGYPGVSTLNSPSGATIANAAIVPAGVGGAITVLPSNATELIIDVNGYFAP